MIQHVCQDCLKEYDIQKNEGTSFPSFTLLGGIIGGLAGLFLGPIVLVPAGLVAGATTDIIRCQICGNSRNVLTLMQSKHEIPDQKTFVRVPFRLYEDVEPLEDMITLEEPPREYRFDEIEGRFIPMDFEEVPLETPESNPTSLDMLDYDATFDVADVSLDSSVSGIESDGFGDWGSDSGLGDGGDFGAGGSGGESGGGE